MAAPRGDGGRAVALVVPHRQRRGAHQQPLLHRHPDAGPTAPRLHPAYHRNPCRRPRLRQHRHAHRLPARRRLGRGCPCVRRGLPRLSFCSAMAGCHSLACGRSSSAWAARRSRFAPGKSRCAVICSNKNGHSHTRASTNTHSPVSHRTARYLTLRHPQAARWTHPPILVMNQYRTPLTKNLARCSVVRPARR